MLIPSSDDPNRQSELERMKIAPKDFGGKPDVPKDWKPEGAEQKRRGRPPKEAK